MIRNVSREDYLLARGANPRTGIVTPGTHSTNSSLDEIQELKSRGLVPPGKWRQRGNQWISLEFSQPSPMPTPTSASGHPDPTLRTPARLTASKYNHARVDSQPGAPMKHEVVQQSSATGDEKEEVPGAYPETPQGDKSQHPPSLLPGSAISRKQIGSPLKTPTGGPGPSILCEAVEGLPPGPPAHLLKNDNRSSSAPTPWKPYPFSPLDVGKDIPAPSAHETIPQHVTATANKPDPFLGLQKPRSASGTMGIPKANTVKKLDKELPCLPMNNGPFPSPHNSNLAGSPKIRDVAAIHRNGDTLRTPQMSLRAQLSDDCPDLRQLSNPQGPKTMDLEQRFTRPQRASPSLECLAIHPQGGRAMDVRSPDNLSQGRHQVKRRKQDHQEQKPTRTVQRTIPTSFDDILLAPIGISTTISKSTDIYTDTLMNNVPRHPNGRPRSPKTQVREPMNGHVHSGPNVSTPNHRGEVGMDMSMSSSDLIGVPAMKPPVRPRARLRPQMPARSEALHNVPKLDPAPRRPRRREQDTAPSHQWSMIGMPITPNTADDMDGASILGGPDRGVVMQEASFMAPAQVPQNIMRNIGVKAEHTTQTPDTTHKDGLFRKCSRCTHGFVQDQAHQRRTDGRVSSTGTFQTAPASHLDCVDENHEYETDKQVMEGLPPAQFEEIKRPDPWNIPVRIEVSPARQPVRSPVQKAALMSSIRPVERQLVKASSSEALLRPDILPRRGSENPLEAVFPNGGDHTDCCPQCCRESDCHDGCLGHPSPSATPITQMRAGESHPNSRSGSIVSLEGQPLTPLSERSKKLSFVKTAFKKGFQKSNITSKEAQTPITTATIKGAADIELWPSELSCAPASPVLLWADKMSGSGSHLAATVAKSAIEGEISPTESNAEAAAAAKSAMRMKATTGVKRPGFFIKKGRKKVDELKGDANGAASPGAKRKVSPNESRHVAIAAAPVSAAGANDSASIRSLKRAPSVLSNTSSTDIQLPPTTVGAVAAMFLMPIDVSRMWLRNHPGVTSSGWQVLERMWTMMLVVLSTGEGCWRMVYIYSKTGKWKAPKPRGQAEKEGWSFVWDCVRSVGYMVVLVAGLVLCVRVVGWVVGVLRIVVMVIRAVLWVGKVLLGGGTGW